MSPGMAGRGLFIATVGHMLLSAVFALNLLAVSGSALPWQQLAWTIPAITTISCLPFTVAGAGMREAAAITLLGLYAVPTADAVVASLLTMIHKLAWAGVGAGVLWREQTLQERADMLPPPATISLVLSANAAVPASLPAVAETFVVPDAASLASVQFAAAKSKGDVIVFVPPRVSISPEVLRELLDALRDPTVVGGVAPSGSQPNRWGIVSPAWWWRVLRSATTQSRIEVTQTGFTRRATLLAVVAEEAETGGTGMTLQSQLKRRGRFIVL